MSTFSRLFLNSLRQFGFKHLTSQTMLKKSSQIVLKTCLIYGPYTLLSQRQIHCINRYPSQLSQTKSSPLTINLSPDQKQWLQTLKYLASHISRLFQLLIIFMPTIIMLPLRCFKTTQQIWIDTFVKAIQKAGVVWIKVFQYLSHRRDIIGPQMAESFTYLRENAPMHSFQATKKMFTEAYGKDILQIFQEFDTLPIASGSVSQVYKAKYHGRKVAVKVRHPEVDTYIQRDVQLLFGISRFGSLFSKRMKIPIGQQSMKRTLMQQIDFTIQKQNLNTFNRMFYQDRHVRFPKAFQSSSKDTILVQTFIQGKPITYYQSNPHPLNQVIARIGAKAFFQMLMKNNFIHADCHGGNIIIDMKKEKPSFFGEIKDYARQNWLKIKDFATQRAITEDKIKKIYRDSQNQQAKMRKTLRQCNQTMKLTLIDAGMVIKLSQQDKTNFIQFVKSIIQSQGPRCAQMIYSLSSYNNRKILPSQFPSYHKALLDVFSTINNQNLDNLEGMALLTGMLDTIRDNNMKLDGEFATLLTNIVVLEGMARDLDPKINIMKCAIPYFQNREHPIGDRAEASFLTAV